LLTNPGAGAGLNVNCAIANSPAARPGTTNGLLLGFGLAVGEATGIRLAPVNSEIDPVDTVVMSGDS
jgi:ABC-type phosphate transport system permease subunit